MPFVASHHHVDESAAQIRDFDDEITVKKPKKPASRTTIIFRRILRYAFSHIGLCILLAAYCGGGAVIFRWTDGGRERSLKEEGKNYAHLLEQEKQNLSWWLTNLTSRPDCCLWV